VTDRPDRTIDSRETGRQTFAPRSWHTVGKLRATAASNTVGRGAARPRGDLNLRGRLVQMVGQVTG